MIRPAELRDAAGIAAVSVAGWQAAYRNIFSDEHLDSLEVAARTTRWEQILDGDAARTGTRTSVLDIDGRIRAFASWGPPRYPGCADRPAWDAELWAMYVHPDGWRCQLGAALMGDVYASMRRSGVSTAMLWVLTDNTSARRFYEARGWVCDNVTRDETRFAADAPVNETRYSTRLGFADQRAGRATQPTGAALTS